MWDVTQLLTALGPVPQAGWDFPAASTLFWRSFKTTEDRREEPPLNTCSIGVHLETDSNLQQLMGQAEGWGVSRENVVRTEWSGGMRKPVS